MKCDFSLNLWAGFFGQSFSKLQDKSLLPSHIIIIANYWCGITDDCARTQRLFLRFQLSLFLIFALLRLLYLKGFFD